MNKLKSVLAAIDKKVNEVKPSTMDELIDTVHKVEGAGSYGSSYQIVKYMGYLQGIRVVITGRSKEHFLPSKDGVYSVFQDVDKFEKAGFKVVHGGQCKCNQCSKS